MFFGEDFFRLEDLADFKFISFYSKINVKGALKVLFIGHKARYNEENRLSLFTDADIPRRAEGSADQQRHRLKITKGQCHDIFAEL